MCDQQIGHRENSLFDFDPYQYIGTSIYELKKYIGIFVDINYDACFNNIYIKKGTVVLIEEVIVDGTINFRIELDNNDAFMFFKIKDVISFFDNYRKGITIGCGRSI